MNRTQAVQLLHDHHPDVVEAPEGAVDRDALQFELFWFQGHVCDLIDMAHSHGVKRCFETVHRAYVEGDPEVREAVVGHFLKPDLVHVRELDWAIRRMPEDLAEACKDVRSSLPAEAETTTASE